MDSTPVAFVIRIVINKPNFIYSTCFFSFLLSLRPLRLEKYQKRNLKILLLSEIFLFNRRGKKRKTNLCVKNIFLD
jgi:hypothetical protein